MRRRNQAGFTLIELIIVLAILGLCCAGLIGVLAANGYEPAVAIQDYSTDTENVLRQEGIWSYTEVPYTGGCSVLMRNKTVRVKPAIGLGEKNVCCNTMTCTVTMAW